MCKDWRHDYLYTIQHWERLCQITDSDTGETTTQQTTIDRVIFLNKPYEIAARLHINIA